MDIKKFFLPNKFINDLPEKFSWTLLLSLGLLSLALYTYKIFYLIGFDYALEIASQTIPEAGMLGAVYIIAFQPISTLFFFLISIGLITITWKMFSRYYQTGNVKLQKLFNLLIYSYFGTCFFNVIYNIFYKSENSDFLNVINFFSTLAPAIIFYYGFKLLIGKTFIKR